MVSILRVQNLAKSFGVEELFHDVNFNVYSGDKIGFIGANGTGKSTLMKCILGLEEYDSGTVSLDQARIGYMQQNMNFSSKTLYEELQSAYADVLELENLKYELEEAISRSGGATDEQLLFRYARVTEQYENLGGYDFESQIRKVAFGLGFSEEDFSRSPLEFSGGQRTRIALAKALIRQPDFLLLDEPTNHLDIQTIEWLEGFLSNYNGGILLISHDRFFLDRVTNKTIDLEHKTIVEYNGNYTTAIKLRAERRAALESAYAKQQEKIKATEEFIRKYKAGVKSKQARGREKQLSRLERIILPPNKANFNYFMFHRPEECAQRVLEVEDVSGYYGEREIFRNISLLIRKTDGVALVGPNGAGKTTLLKLIVGDLTSPTGEIVLGSRVRMAYYSQQHENLTESNTLFEEIVSSFGLDDEQARAVLGNFLFRGDDIYKVVGSLSGGEKSRLALLKLLLTGANFLVLDEPTNHLDIPAREALEDAIMAFPGTFIVVSHDRYFLDKLTNITMELNDGKLTVYNGNFTYYRDKKQEEEAEAKAALEAAEVVEIATSSDAFTSDRKSLSQEKVRANPYRAFSQDKLEQTLAKLEATMAMYEAELKFLEVQMNNPDNQLDPIKSADIAQEYAHKEAQIDASYHEWEQLLEEIDARSIED